MRSRIALLAGLTTCGLLDATTGEASVAGPYDFVVIADTADGYRPDFMGCPVLNSAGQVAFGTKSVDKHFQLWRFSGDGLTLLAEKGLPGGMFTAVSINDSGEVAATSSRIVDERSVDKLRRSDGARRVQVAEEGIGEITGAQITESGYVAYTRQFDGLFSAKRIGHETPVLTRDNSDFRDIKDLTVRADLIAFTSFLVDEPGIALYSRSADGTITRIAGSQDYPSNPQPSEPSIGPDGDVAFINTYYGSNPQNFVMVGDGESLRTVADREGPFRSLSSPSINAAGTVAFSAALDEFPAEPGRDARTGVYTGPDRDRDAVIEPGDGLGGSTVYSAEVCTPESFNDAGQVAFRAVLDDGRVVVARADPR